MEFCSGLVGGPVAGEGEGGGFDLSAGGGGEVETGDAGDFGEGFGPQGVAADGAVEGEGDPGGGGRGGEAEGDGGAVGGFLEGDGGDREIRRSGEDGACGGAE